MTSCGISTAYLLPNFYKKLPPNFYKIFGKTCGIFPDISSVTFTLLLFITIYNILVYTIIIIVSMTYLVEYLQHIFCKILQNLVEKTCGTFFQKNKIINFLLFQNSTKSLEKKVEFFSNTFYIYLKIIKI